MSIIPFCLDSGVRQERRIGLLAGSGRFPICFAEKARKLGLSVVCVGIREEASAELIDLCDRFHWAGVSKLGRIIRCFKKEGIRDVVMAGKIRKSLLFTPLRVIKFLPDLRTLRFAFWTYRQDNRDDTILLGIINEFGKDGIGFGSALTYCPELLVNTGELTSRKLSARDREDVAFGWEVAKEMGRLDVGQSVVVKEKAVLAVEAIEGTDKAIQRAGELCRAGGFTVVKVAKPQQDMRFDVPTIGPQTIEIIRSAGGKVLAIEARKTIIIDEEETVALANQHGISIVAITNAEARQYRKYDQEGDSQVIALAG